MDIRAISKAIAGAAASGIGAMGTTAVVIPQGVDVPWWGYVIVGTINAVFGFALVYFAPRNAPSK